MVKKIIISVIILGCSAVLLSTLLLFYYFPKGSVILMPMGGMGNQIFQYAAAHSLAKSTDSKLYVIIDPKSEKKGNTSVFDRNSALTQFAIPKENILYNHKIVTSLIKLSKHLEKINKFFSIIDVVEENLMSLKGKKNTKLLLMRTYFESEIFFAEHKDEIREMFDIDKSQYAISVKDNKALNSMIPQLQQDNSICVHVRRRDFCELHYMSIRYQKQAIELSGKLIANPQFYIFSDDIERVKDELGASKDITYMSREDSLPMEDFFLMSKCANNINANSTFSWWASYLNKNYDRLVIQPHPRLNDYILNTKIDNKEHFYAWKSITYGRSNPSNWVLLAYNQKTLPEESKGVISDEEYNKIFAGYKVPSFNIYSGDLAQLDLCKKDSDFRSGLCFLNGKNSPKPTVVTAYYRVANKHGHENYLKWASNFLTIPFNLVVFTDKENIDWIKKMRGGLPLTVIEKDKSEFYHAQFHKTYQRDYAQDNNKSHSPELYRIWAEKIKFVNEAIDINPYKSEYFVWCDLGTFRETDYVSNNFLYTKFMWKGRVSFSIVEEFTLQEMAERLMNSNAIRVGGNIQIGEAAAWRVYNKIWDITRNDMMDNGIPTANDQRIMGTIALRYPWLVHLHYRDFDYAGNPWWHMLMYYQSEIKI